MLPPLLLLLQLLPRVRLLDVGPGGA